MLSTLCKIQTDINLEKMTDVLYFSYQNTIINIWWSFFLDEWMDILFFIYAAYMH